MVFELIRKHDWENISFEIFWRFGVTTVILLIIAGVLSMTGGPIIFTNGDDNAILTITMDDLITGALIWFGISMIGLIAPIAHAFFYGYIPQKRKEKQV